MNNKKNKYSNNSNSSKKRKLPLKPVFLPEDFFDAEGNDVDYNSAINKKIKIDYLSKKNFIETLNNQKNVENKSVALFSNNKPNFSPENFFDEQGNEVKEKDNQKPESIVKKEEEISKENNNEDSISCLRCAHYYITWNVKYPRGCRKYALETDLIPSDAVLIYTCKGCQYFKNKFKKTDPKIFAEMLDQYKT